MKNLNYCCPSCGRLETVPWEAAWCLHNGKSIAHPPSWIDSDWTRMVPVVEVKLGELPPEADEWYVVESRNNFGYPGNKVPKGLREKGVVAGPMTREEAYAYAKGYPRDEGVPEHVHSVRTEPGDLIKYWQE